MEWIRAMRRVRISLSTTRSPRGCNSSWLSEELYDLPKIPSIRHLEFEVELEEADAQRGYIAIGDEGKAVCFARTMRDFWIPQTAHLPSRCATWIREGKLDSVVLIFTGKDDRLPRGLTEGGRQDRGSREEFDEVNAKHGIVATISANHPALSHANRRILLSVEGVGAATGDARDMLSQTELDMMEDDASVPITSGSHRDRMQRSICERPRDSRS